MVYMKLVSIRDGAGLCWTGPPDVTFGLWLAVANWRYLKYETEFPTGWCFYLFWIFPFPFEKAYPNWPILWYIFWEGLKPPSLLFKTFQSQQEHDQAASVGMPTTFCTTAGVAHLLLSEIQWFVHSIRLQWLKPLAPSIHANGLCSGDGP